MLDKTYKVEVKHQQLLNKEAKRRFDEVWSTKTIAKQRDTFHVTIWVGLLPSSYAAPSCGFNAFCMVPQHEDYNGEEESQTNES
jgi:hypothetical protein